MVLYIPNNAHLIVQLRSLAITPHDIVIIGRSTYSSESVPIFFNTKNFVVVNNGHNIYMLIKLLLVVD